MVAKRHEILFIDANVVDKQTLIADVAPNVKIIELNDKTNAISQIVTALKNQKNLDAIHIISQGSSGELEFANGTLNNDNLSHYTSQLQKIGSSLSKNGDILLYGCDVAKGTEGSAFVKAFAKVTSADVAASIDTTGAASLGGDWKLEKLNGVIASKTFASTDYAYTLANKTIAQTFPEGTGSALAYKTNYDGMSGLSALTVEMWIKTSDTNGSLLSWAASGMGNDFLLAMTSQSNFAIWVGNKHYDVANTLNISDNNWHHLAATWSTAGTVKLYVDGTAYTATLGFTTATPPVQYEAYTSPLTDSSAITTDRLLLGNDQDMVSGVISALNSTQTFSGSMDAVAIWNSAKTFTPSTYKTAIAGNETGLINYWSMDESTGNLVDSKNAANLTTDRATNQLTTETFDITSAVAIDVNENVATSATVYTIVSNAGSGRYASVDYSISGTDSALFNVAASTGIITFKSSTNYELPLDSGANRIYDLSVTATGKDHLGATIDVASQNLAITLKDVNEAPTVVTLSNATTTLAENTDSTTRIKVADIAVTDDALGTNALSLTGAEASYFEISGNVLYLKAATVLDYENKTSYAVTVNALDSMLAGSIAVATNYSLAITNVNEAPVITSDDTGTVAENAATSTVIYTTVATDVDSNDTRTYSLKAATGDVGLLAINATTGAVTLKNSADFETKASYTFTVIATDAGSLSAEKAVTVSVTNVNEAPVITSNGTGTVAENSAPSTVIYTALASDVDVSDTRTYSLKASTGDVGLLAINAATGEVTLKNSADFETKASYTFTVIATDTGGLSAEKAVTVSVTNVNDLPTGNVTISGIAKQGEILTAAHSLADADGLGTVAYQWKANGTAISGATASTYTLTQADVGKTFTVTASYIDGLGTAESVISNATTTIANLNDLPTGSVTISGTAKQGEILTAANSLADADGLGTVGYQWKANGTAISGATASTYTLTQAEVGKTLTVTASYIDGLGTKESITSTKTLTVENNLPFGGFNEKTSLLTIGDFNASIENMTADVGASGKLSGKIALTGYDAIRTDEKPLNLMAKVTYDATKKISLTAALDSNTPWEKPFGLTGTKINDLSLAMVGTYSPFAFKKVDFTSTLERDGTNTGIAKLLKIESVAVKISIDVETKKTTLNGTLSGDIPLLPTVGELGVDLKEAKLKVEKTGENYATDISGKIVLKGYDPTRTDEPNLLLNGGVSVKEKTLSLSASLDSNTPWENPFGLMGSKITVLSLIAESTIDSSAFQKVDFDATLAWNEKGKGATGISEFMYDELGIRSLVVAIKVDSGAKDSKTKESTTDNFSGETISLSGVATVKKQLVSVGDFKVTLTKEKLELAKNDSVSFAILSSQIVLAGYDPSQKNEPDLFLNGSLAVSSEKEIALNVALDETTPWINPFGLSGTKMSVLSLDVVGKLSPAALTVGFDATVEWNSTKINPAIGASKFLNDLGVKSLSVHVGLDTEKQSMSIKGTIDMQIQVFKVEVKPNDYFSLTLTQSSVEMMLTLSTPNLSLSLLGRMELKGYDFSQRYEPTLTVTGAVQLDLTSIALGVSFSTGAKPWMNPFGLKGFEITTLAVQIGATYIPPYLDSFGFVADVGFYNTSFAAGFYIKLSNPTVAFYIETKPDKPLNLANLIDGSLSSFKELNGVRESVNKLFSKSNITIESIDGDNNGDLDPLILFSPTGDVKVVDQVIPGGMGINGKVTFGDFSAILALNTDKNFSKTTTGLVLSVDKSVNFKALMVDDSPWIMLLEQFEFSQKPLEQLQQVIKLFTNLIGGDVAKISPISDTKGNILPLVKFIPNASGLQVGKTQYDAGFSFNVQLDVLGEYSLIKFNANAKFTKLSGSLEISTIHIGKILSLSGIKDSDPLTLVVKFFAKDFLLSGNGKLELFGVTIASAKFTINTKSIEIQNVNINLGVIALSNADLSATIGSVNVTGSSKIKLLGMTIADSDFSMSNHKFSINKGTFSLFGATFNIAGSSLNMDSDILTGTIKITLGDFGVLNAKIIATPKTVTFGTSVSFKIPLVATVKFGLLISTNGDVVIAVDSKIFGHKYSFDASTNLKDITISKLTALIWDAIDGKDTDKPEKWTGNATSEEYSGGGSADKLSGEGGNDSIRGNGGNDVIEAGKGNDVIIGGKGNDTLNGNEGNDSIEGNSGKDMLDGGSGVDTLEGGDGDDTYTVDNEKDIVKEDKSSGDDTVETMLLSYSLSANVEDLIFTEISNHNGTGNVLNNQITGNNGNDSLKGMAGNDKLNGEKGDDVIYGGDGDDKLNGGAGADTLEGGDDKDTLDGGDGQDLMIGGKGADVFVVRLENSNDVIQDFSNAQSDKIDLSTIDANILKAKNQAFTFIEGEAFSAAGQIRFETTTSTLYGNVNADLAADFSIKISGVSTLITANFIL